MTHLHKTLPLLAAMVAAPVWAAQPAPPAAHRAPGAEAAKPTPTPEANLGMHACSMMDGKMASGAGAPDDKAPDSKMMMGDKDMHCMPAPAAPKAAEPPHDHDHPEAAPK